MKKLHLVLVALLLVGLPELGALGQQTAPSQDAAQASTPRKLLALTYPEQRTVTVEFESTKRHPQGRGEARVRRRRGITEIEIRLDEMKPALLFGGDYNTYVLWTLSPEGLMHNGGEFILRGNRSELNATTPLTTFGMIVTAEPHFLVSAPSPFVVLQNVQPSGGSGPVQATMMTYRGFDGTYNYQRESIADQQETRGEFRADRQQAMTAVALAERAKAERYARDELTRARQALNKTIAAIGSRNPEQITVRAHEAVRLAVEAQQLAERRAREVELEADRKARAEEIAGLSEMAQQAKLQAEQLARAKAEAEMAAAQSRKEAEEASRAKAAAEEAAEQARWQRAQAEEMMKRAQQEADRLAQLKAEAETTAQEAVREREELRARMHQALSRVVETKETARGIIVNLPDILFDSGRATLRSPAREVLSRVAGILLVMPEYRLTIEGHTDSVGSDTFNQKLSEERAQRVYDYLGESGVSRDLMTTAGFGESSPIASNDTSQGRQQNRRVEIVIQDLALPQSE